MEKEHHKAAIRDPGTAWFQKLISGSGPTVIDNAQEPLADATDRSAAEGMVIQ